MSDLYTMTPGSAVSDKLQEILVRKKMEQRQALLDSVNVMDKQRQWTSQDKADAINASQEERAGKMDKYNITKGKVGMVPGGVSEDRIKDTDVRGFLDSIGLFETDPGTGGETITNPDGSPIPPKVDGENLTFGTPPTVAPTRRFVGNEGFQKEEANRNRILALAKDTTLPAKDPLEQALLINAAGGQVPAGALGPDPNVWHMGPTGNMKKGQKIGRNDKVVETGFPPQPPASIMVPPYIGTDSQGNPLFQGRGIGKDGQVPLITGAVPGGGPINAKPSASQSDMFPPNLMTAYSQLPTKAGVGSDAKEAGYRQIEDSLVANARNVDPVVKQFVNDKLREIRGRYESGKTLPSPEAIIANAKASIGGIDPADEAAIRNIITVVTSRYNNGR